MARYDLSEAEWRLIEPLLPNKPRGVARVDDRRVINGIFYVLRTGSPWRDLPSRYGPHTTVYNRYNRWAKAGVWLAVFKALAERSPDLPQRVLRGDAILDLDIAEKRSADPVRPAHRFPPVAAHDEESRSSTRVEAAVFQRPARPHFPLLRHSRCRALATTRRGA